MPFFANNFRTSASTTNRDRALEDMLEDIIDIADQDDHDVPGAIESDSQKDVVVSASDVVLCGQVPSLVSHAPSMKPPVKRIRFCPGSADEDWYFVLAGGLSRRLRHHRCCSLCALRLKRGWTPLQVTFLKKQWLELRRLDEGVAQSLHAQIWPNRQETRSTRGCKRCQGASIMSTF